MSQPLMSASQFPDLLARPADASAAFGVFSLYDMEPPNRATLTCADHILALVVGGTCRLRRNVNGKSSEGWSGPGTINLIPAHVEGTWEGRNHHGATRTIALFVPGAFLSRVIAQQWDAEPRNVEIVSRFLVRDPIIQGVLTRLAFEARHESPSGRLYAESACEFLARHMVHAYSSLAARPLPSAGGLPPWRLRCVLEYIEEHLAESLSLYRLAEVAAVSPRHFERAFRQALGVAPHAYVLSQRVCAAQHLLLSEPRLAIEKVAARAGFSSSSHLATVFRRRMGLSPRAFRARHTIERGRAFADLT